MKLFHISNESSEKIPAEVQNMHGSSNELYIKFVDKAYIMINPEFLFYPCSQLSITGFVKAENGSYNLKSFTFSIEDNKEQ